MSEEKQITIEVRKLYVSDLSVEVPHAPQIFQQEVKPEVALSISHEIKDLPEENYYAVELKVTVTARDLKTDNRIIYLVELKQGGVFEMVGLDNVNLHHALNVFAPTTLYPYAREVISSRVNGAGFPHLFLQPVNFEALYQEQVQKLLAEQNQGKSE